MIWQCQHSSISLMGLLRLENFFCWIASDSNVEWIFYFKYTYSMHKNAIFNHFVNYADILIRGCQQKMLNTFPLKSSTSNAFSILKIRIYIYIYICGTSFAEPAVENRFIYIFPLFGLHVTAAWRWLLTSPAATTRLWLTLNWVKLFVFYVSLRRVFDMQTDRNWNDAVHVQYVYFIM